MVEHGNRHIYSTEFGKIIYIFGILENRNIVGHRKFEYWIYRKLQKIWIFEYWRIEYGKSSNPTVAVIYRGITQFQGLKCFGT